MTDCLSVIHHPLPDDIGRWEQVSQMTNVLHTEEVDIVSVASGYLEIEPFCLPGVDCRLVGALVFHCCLKGNIESWTDVIRPHVFQDQGDTCIQLNCWDLNPKYQADDATACWISDPCQRAHELRCCQMEWLKEGKNKSFSFRDSSGTKSFLSEESLNRLISEAESQCDAMNCVNTRCMNFTCGPVRCG